MAWRLAKSLETLRKQVNKAYPKRNKASDGTIGDSAHAKVPSDHNPTSKGVVTALDLTHHPKYFDAHKLADRLIKNRHPNLEYVISNKRIAGAWTNWKWAKYNGSNPHDKHIHISVGDGRADGQALGNYDSTKKWSIIEPMYKMKFAGKVRKWTAEKWAKTAKSQYAKRKEAKKKITELKAKKGEVNEFNAIGKALVKLITSFGYKKEK